MSAATQQPVRASASLAKEKADPVLPGSEPEGSDHYRIAPWVVVRTPLLPATCRDLARDPRTALTLPSVVSALAVGAPDLLDTFDRPSLTGADSARADRGLARYLIRMSTRPTPYGAFAGVSLARWGDTSSVELAGADRLRTRPDMGWLRTLLESLLKDPGAARRLRWRAVPLCYHQDGRVVGTHGTILATTAVHAALETAVRWIDWPDLNAAVADRTGGTTSQVDRLLEEMRVAGVLEVDAGPALTGATATSGLDAVRVLGSLRPDLAAKVSGVVRLMRDVDLADPERTRDQLRAVAAAVGSAFPDSATPTSQSDLCRPLRRDTLNAAVGSELAKACELLLRICPADTGSQDLRTYTSRFLARYGRGRAVPLCEVFDPVHGLGPLPHTHGGSAGVDRNLLGRRHDALLQLALGAVRNHRLSVQLDATTIAAMTSRPARPEQLPLSLDVTAFVVADDPAGLDRGDFTVVLGPNLGASSAGRWLGRFADLFDEGGRSCFEWLRDAETAADPERVSAEVVYLPAHQRSTNVLVRPVFDDTEILVSGRGGGGSGIDLAELSVSVEEGRLRLWSQRHQREIRPTARHMLNLHGAPPVCQFLDLLARGDGPDLVGFDWGPTGSLPFTPRVEYGRVVLAPARWTLTVGHFPDPVDDPSLRAALRVARDNWGLPSQVYVSTADNRLLLDLDHPDDVEQLRRQTRSLPDGLLRLDEALPDTSDAWLPSPSGTHIAEVVVSLVRQTTRSPRRPDSTPGPTARTAPTVLTEAPVTPPVRGPRLLTSVDDRVRGPGTDWLFVKLYAPYGDLTGLLTGPLADVISMVENSGLARRWFFLRYSDPDPHLRLRWQGDADVLLRHVLPQVTELSHELMRAGRLRRMAVDTYEREVERYGGPMGLDVSEDVFHADSRAVHRLLAQRTTELSDLAVASTVTLLAGLGLDAQQRISFYRNRIESVGGSDVDKAAGADYRRRQRHLRDLLTGGASPAMVRIQQDLTSALARSTVRLDTAERGQELWSPPSELWTSYVHMHHNRLVGPVANPTEPHLWHLLLRTERGLALSSERKPKT